MSNKKRQSYLKNAILTGLLTASLAGFSTQVFAKPGGNPVQECQEHSALYFAKYDWENDEYVQDSAGGVVNIVGNATSGTWSSDTAIDIMIVKGSTIVAPTQYDPAANNGSFDNNGIEGKDISHITFCVYEQPEPGTCCLDYNYEPVHGGVGYPGLNLLGFHVHQLPLQDWAAEELVRYLSCYMYHFPDWLSVTEENCEAAVGKFYPIPDNGKVEVLSAHWFPGVTFGKLKKLEIVPTSVVKLLATGVNLTATKNGTGVDLTLSTNAEPDTAALLILRGDKRENGGTEIDVACDFASGGSPYVCTDAPAADTYRAAEVEYDGSLIIYDEVTPK